MSFTDEFDQSIRDTAMKRIADDILQGITKVREKPGLSARRWLWELMQNARDVPNDWNGVSIKVILNSNSIQICHNGQPFSLTNLNHLIMQVSSKSEGNEDDSVGKFGTGFLVTHLLSKALNLKGILKLDNEDLYRFQIEIDRSAESSLELQKKIEVLLEHNRNLKDNFEKLENYAAHENIYETVFEFPLDEESLVHAKKGIEDLVNTLPLTLVFSDKIKSVEIHNRITDKKNSFSRILMKDNSVKAIKNNDLTDYFWLKYKGEISIALRIDNLKTPIPWDKNTPKLYRDFPLIGSEDFNSAFVIHSSNFNPDEMRSGLLLTDIKNAKVGQNRELLIACQELIKDFVSEVKTTDNNYLLAESGIPKILKGEGEEETRIWFENNIQKPYRDFLLNNLKFNNIKKSEVVLNHILIPNFETGTVEQKINFYDVVQGFYNVERIPTKESFRNWLGKIDENYEKWETSLLINVGDLTNEICKKKNFRSFQNYNIVELVKSFNLYFKFLNDTGNADVIQTKQIIPDDAGQFRFLNDLSINDNIQEVFLDIREIEYPNYRALNLIHKHVNVRLTHKKLTSKDILKEIIEIINIKDYGTKEIYQVKLIHKLLQLQHSENDNFQSKVFSIYCDFFNLEKEIIIIPREEESFDFKPIVKVALRIILNKISGFARITDLSSNLKLDVENTILWLNSFLVLVNDNNTNREILNEYKVFPNFHGDFMFLEKLYKVEGVSESISTDIINFYEELLPKNELKMVLIHPQISINVINVKSVGEICGGLDEKVRLYYSQWSDLKDEEKSKVFDLLEWASLNDENQIIFRHHFHWLQQNRALIFMEQFDSPEVKDAMYSIMKSDKETILAVGEMMKNKSAEQIKKIMDVNPDTFERIHNIIENLEEKELKIIEKFAEEKKEEKSEFAFMKSIGNAYEKVFEKYANENNFGFNIERKENPADFVLSKNGVKFYIELKSISPKAITNEVKLSYNQVEGSIKHNGFYALCYLKRPLNWQVDFENEVGYQIMIRDTKVILDLGERIKDGFALANSFKSKLLDDELNGLKVEFKDNKFKFIAGMPLLRDAENIETLFNEIRNKLKIKTDA